MIEVVKAGMNKCEITCPNCNSILRFYPGDTVKNDEFKHLKIIEYGIECPLCKMFIKTYEHNYITQESKEFYKEIEEDKQ